MLFKNRTAAGRALVPVLAKYKRAKKTVVLGLPRGGVVVAYEVAKALELPLDILIPRKIGSPDNPELAIGAIAGDGVVLDKGIIDALHVPESYIQAEIAKEKQEAERRLAFFRENKPPRDWSG